MDRLLFLFETNNYLSAELKGFKYFRDTFEMKWILSNGMGSTTQVQILLKTFCSVPSIYTSYLFIVLVVVVYSRAPINQQKLLFFS